MTQLKLTAEFKQGVIAELLKVREHFGGTDYAFATKWGISSPAFSLIKNATEFKLGSPADKSISEVKWLSLGRELGVSLKKDKWNIARTEVFTRIEQEVKFCQVNSKSMVLVDDCEIGKTYTAVYLSKTTDNCFYLDCSQSKTKREFLKAFAKAIGVQADGTYAELKASVKYYLRDVLIQPVVIIDEAGDLEQEAFLLLKEFWNATEGCCGWYMMGADGLRAKIDRGIANKTIGYREIFSRYSRKFRKVTPNQKDERNAFYTDLITAVLSANCDDKKLVAELVKKSLVADSSGEIGGLRRAQSLLILSKQNN